jgi:hypothetical protein
MTVPGPFFDTGITELIDDCSALPTALCGGAVVAPDRPAPAWVVSDECQAQAEALDAYL